LASVDELLEALDRVDLGDLESVSAAGAPLATQAAVAVSPVVGAAAWLDGDRLIPRSMRGASPSFRWCRSIPHCRAKRHASPAWCRAR
jgi:hypothetical protein